MFVIEINKMLLTRVSTIIERTEGERGRLETLINIPLRSMP